MYKRGADFPMNYSSMKKLVQPILQIGFYASFPDITSFVGWNERNKVGVRDAGGAKRKRSTEIYEHDEECCYIRNEGSTIKVHQ